VDGFWASGFSYSLCFGWDVVFVEAAEVEFRFPFTSLFTSQAASCLTPSVNVTCIWDKLTKLAAFCLLLLGLFAVSLWYLPLIRQNERMRQQLLQNEAKIKAEEELGRSLKGSFDAARSNPKTIERMARANLGYARPGEIVVRFEEPRK
jgi:cell division protein FtsB